MMVCLLVKPTPLTYSQGPWHTTTTTVVYNCNPPLLKAPLRYESLAKIQDTDKNRWKPWRNIESPSNRTDCSAQELDLSAKKLGSR